QRRDEPLHAVSAERDAAGRMRLVVVLAIVACGPPAGDQHSRGDTTLQGFQTRMCACRDKACANGVIDEMGKWTRRIPPDAPKPDPAVTAPIMAVYNECMKRAIATP